MRCRIAGAASVESAHDFPLVAAPITMSHWRLWRGRDSHWPVTSTMRNLALPAIIRSYASPARSSGMVSIIGRSCDCTEKRNVSSESCEVPVEWPVIVREPPMSCKGVTSIGSAETPTTMSLPHSANPSIRSSWRDCPG